MLPYYIKTDVTTEPVTLAEAKAHLRVLGDTDNDYISSLISSAREYAESVHDKTYGTKTIEAVADYVGDYILPVRGLSSLTSVIATGSDGITHDITSDFYLDPFKSELIYAGNGVSDLAEINPVRITYIASGAPTKATKQAMLLLIGHWYEHREEAVIGGMATLPMAAKQLLDLERHGAM